VQLVRVQTRIKTLYELRTLFTVIEAVVS